MDQFIASLPKPVLAIGAIIIGFVILVLLNPPVTVCDSQMEIFRESQQGFLYPRTELNVTRQGRIRSLFEECQTRNDPGGCFNYFQGLKKLSLDLRDIPHQCSDTAAQEAEIKNWLLKSLELMAQIAWGDNGPSSYYDKHGWFDASDVALFCSLKTNASQIVGEEAIYDWRANVIKQLPGASKLNTDEQWRKSIFSTPCESYR